MADPERSTLPPTKQILILGAGFGGLEAATGLAEGLPEGYGITLVDRSGGFFVGFSKIDVLFGRATPAEVSYRYEDLRADPVRVLRDEVTGIDTGGRTVRTTHHTLTFDYLVVALGADLDHEAVPGFVESGGHEFYSMEGARALAPVLRRFDAGTVALGIFRPPYKCPPAPYEVACQLHDFFAARGVRDRVDLRMIIPGPRPLPNPAVSDMLEAQLAAHGVELLADAPIRALDAGARQVLTHGGAVDYDLFVGVPVHVPPAVVRASGLGDGGFVRVDPETLETSVPDVYAVGDVSTVPAGDKAVPKAGAFAEDAARTVVSDILRKEGLAGERIPFQARGACYFEVGSGAVAKVEANYLGGERPDMAVSGPSEELRSDKARFVETRRGRWFRTSRPP